MFGIGKQKTKELRDQDHGESCMECGYRGERLKGIIHDYCPVCGGSMTISFEVVR
jgi:rubrerythrin